jgi:6-pyruvoyltetrahydropterin/6-carboxytetrahydropterin synthase
MVYLTRKAEFSASHYYHNPEFSAEENQRVFGKCNNPNGHGHNYTLEVTVKGEVDPRSGFVVDLKKLKEILNLEVLYPHSYDGKSRDCHLAAPGAEVESRATASRAGI